MRLWNWDVVMFITLLLVAVVMIMDTLSAWLRRRYIGAPRCRCIRADASAHLRRMAAAPYPAYSPKSPLAQGLLKLPVLAASTSLRRSRKAGAARMDAG